MQGAGAAEQLKREDCMMKGYYVRDGYMGYVGNGYMLFASEQEYREYLED